MYSRYTYLYPPRPKHKIDPDNLCKFDNNIFLAQPKLNGSCCLVFTNGEEVIIKNRHKNDFSKFKIDKQEFLKIFRGTNSKWSVYVGEYMNKSQKDEKNKVWNQKFVIFDILVFDNNLLINNNYFERQQLLEKLYPNNQTKPLLHEITNVIWRVENIFTKLSMLFSYFSLKKFKNKLDPRKYNGAIFLGLNGPVVKSHGSIDSIGFYYSIDLCYRIIKGKLMDEIKNNLSHINVN